jgi:hypothetical protein
MIVKTRKSFWKLALLLAPFATAAVAINLFLVGLMFPHLGLPVLSPLQSLVWSLPLGIPASLASAHWVRSLINQAEHPNSPTHH